MATKRSLTRRVSSGFRIVVQDALNAAPSYRYYARHLAIPLGLGGHETHWMPPVLFMHMMVVAPSLVAFIAWQSVEPRDLQIASAWSTLVAAAGVAMLAAIKSDAIVSITL